MKIYMKNGKIITMNNNKEIAKNEVTIDDFPPKLRKLSVVILENIQTKTLKEFCELANVNYNSVRATIPRLKKKGLDFNEYLNNKYRDFLNSNKLDVSKSVVDGAMSGTSADKKLFFQLTGDYTERQQIDHNIQAKIVVFSPSGIPQDLQEEYKKERDENGVQIIDLEFDK